MALSSDAKLAATGKGAEMAERLYNVPRNRIIEVVNGPPLVGDIRKVIDIELKLSDKIMGI